MKILLLDNFHYLRGGAEAVYLNTGDLLKKMGHEVEYYSLWHPENIKSNYDIFFTKGVDYVNKVKGFVKYINNSEAANGLEKLLYQFKPDVAHIHLVWGGLTSAVVKVLKKHNIPVVHTAHDYRMVCPAYTFRNGDGEVCEKCKDKTYFNCIRYKCCKGSLVKSILMASESKWRLITNQYDLFDKIIYVSEFCKNKHIEFNANFANIPSSILFNFYPGNIELTKSPELRKNYTYCGRLSHEKGVATLIKAFKKIPELKLKIIGTGPEKDKLQGIAHGCENIEFVGFKSGRELKELVSYSKFMIVPSEWFENNPMSAIEAESMGVPVISANIGGCPEIVKERVSGFLFDSGDVDDLVRVLKESSNLSISEYTELCKSTIEFAKHKFDSEVYYKQLMKIYNDTICKK